MKKDTKPKTGLADLKADLWPQDIAFFALNGSLGCRSEAMQSMARPLHRGKDRQFLELSA
jgi:hypothetical protein